MLLDRARHTIVTICDIPGSQEMIVEREVRFMIDEIGFENEVAPHTYFYS